MTGEEWNVLAAGWAAFAAVERPAGRSLRPTVGDSSGWLPPELIYAHPVLPSCHQSLPPGCCWLTFHGVDLARGPDGAFRIHGDRAQSPSGAGYTWKTGSFWREPADAVPRRALRAGWPVF